MSCGNGVHGCYFVGSFKVCSGSANSGFFLHMRYIIMEEIEIEDSERIFCLQDEGLESEHHR